MINPPPTISTALLPDLVDEETFYMGLLLALSERTRGFSAHGDLWQTRWVAVVKKAREMGLPYEGLAYPYVFEQHERMILFGMSALLLTLDAPGMTYARLRWSGRHAAKELDQIPHSDVYRACADAFFGVTR